MGRASLLFFLLEIELLARSEQDVIHRVELLHIARKICLQLRAWNLVLVFLTSEVCYERSEAFSVSRLAKAVPSEI